MSGALSKMRIIGFRDPQFNMPVAAFTALLNPDSYTQQYQVEYDRNQAAGTSGNELRFNRIMPQSMDFEFLFDRTGAIPGNDDTLGTGITIDIELFKNVVLDYDGDIHRTRYLKLSWGTLLFKCCLKSLTLNYKLFKSDGTPLRAVARCSFEEFKEDKLRVAEENAQSPDLTRIRVVKEGDTLPKLCYDQYGDSAYYLEVARTNGLKDFRSLRTGQKIVFYPIDKNNL